jgi:hypothetical protein
MNFEMNGVEFQKCSIVPTFWMYVFPPLCDV